MTVREILKSYDEITIGEEVAGRGIFFKLFDKNFFFMAPEENDLASTASIALYNDELLDYPHVILREQTLCDDKFLPAGTYRGICLFEQDSIVNSLLTYEQKIFDTIDRLIELLSMSAPEREREFQKEFLYYWNCKSNHSNIYTAYLKQDDEFAELDIYYNCHNTRLVEKGEFLADLDYLNDGKRNWIQQVDTSAYFIPIIDGRGILPPHRGYDWGEKEILDIIYGKQIEHISQDSFQKIKTVHPNTQKIILLFGLKTDATNVVFALSLKCNNSNDHSLLEKVLYDIVDIDVLYTQRQDYLYLCSQIGNDIGLIQKRILLVGAGSLGSYVAFELVKNGFKNIKIYDGDELEKENVLRWAYGGIGLGSNKASTVSILLNMLHPEINVQYCANNLDVLTLLEEMSNFDMVIFTIGSSDEQLSFNRALKKAGCSIPVLYVWLEAGGIYSHILYVDYKKEGCFECLYTNKDGEKTNNRSAKNNYLDSEAAMVRNGCGGTRAAYGTAILLRTVAALLEIIREVYANGINRNTLFDISPISLVVSDIEFPLGACGCCGNKIKQ